jgi:hypothetical protein
MAGDLDSIPDYESDHPFPKLPGVSIKLGVSTTGKPSWEITVRGEDDADTLTRTTTLANSIKAYLRGEE